MAMVAKNSAMGDFRIDIIYRGISMVCEKVGLLDEETRIAFGFLQDLVSGELAERREAQSLTVEFGPVHSDFWTGKYVSPVAKYCEQKLTNHLSSVFSSHYRMGWLTSLTSQWSTGSLLISVCEHMILVTW